MKSKFDFQVKIDAHVSTGGFLFNIEMFEFGLILVCIYTPNLKPVQQHLSHGTMTPGR